MSNTVSSVFERIQDKLCRSSIPFSVQRHTAVFTSQEAATVRGVPLQTGAKALIVKCDQTFRLFVIQVPADRKLASKRIRKELSIKSFRFATTEEVQTITNGLSPGSIPPFGSLFDLATFCDTSLAETIYFSAGDHSISIGMTSADYRDVESPTLGSYTLIFP